MLSSQFSWRMNLRLTANTVRRKSDVSHHNWQFAVAIDQFQQMITGDWDCHTSIVINHSDLPRQCRHVVRCDPDHLWGLGASALRLCNSCCSKWYKMVSCRGIPWTLKTSTYATHVLNMLNICSNMLNITYGSWTADCCRRGQDQTIDRRERVCRKLACFQNTSLPLDFEPNLILELNLKMFSQTISRI